MTLVLLKTSKYHPYDIFHIEINEDMSHTMSYVLSQGDVLSMPISIRRDGVYL